MGPRVADDLPIVRSEEPGSAPRGMDRLGARPDRRSRRAGWGGEFRGTATRRDRDAGSVRVPVKRGPGPRRPARESDRDQATGAGDSGVEQRARHRARGGGVARRLDGGARRGCASSADDPLPVRDPLRIRGGFPSGTTVQRSTRKRVGESVIYAPFGFPSPPRSRFLPQTRHVPGCGCAWLGGEGRARSTRRGSVHRC